MDREIGGFWWVWRQGDDWPSWYYGEGAARDAVNRISRSSPGRSVSIGTLDVDGTFVTPDKIEKVAQ